MKVGAITPKIYNGDYYKNDLPQDRKISFQEGKKDNSSERMLMYTLAAAGSIALASIYCLKRGNLRAQAVPKKTYVSPVAEKFNVSAYVIGLAESMEKALGINIRPQNLSCILNKTQFLEAVSVLKKENYIASKENIEKGIFRADLHSHSIFSDGRAKVENILEQVAGYADKLFEKTGEKFLYALTDHDSADGVKKALEIIHNAPEKFKNVKFVVGSEVSYLIKADKTTNPLETSELLVYGFDPFSAKVEKFFADIKKRRLMAQEQYIKDLSQLYPATKFSVDEFNDVFLGDRISHNPIMNSYWQLYHYGQIKNVTSETAKARNLNPEEYFKNIMTDAPKEVSLHALKKQGKIEFWINEDSEIIKINEKYKPSISENGLINKTSENVLDDISEAFKDEKECSIGFSHPYYITERTSKFEDVIAEVKSKLGGLLNLTESYHQAYSIDLLKENGGMIDRVSKLCEDEGLIAIGGRDNHKKDFL